MKEEEILSKLSEDTIKRIAKTFENSLRKFDTIEIDQIAHHEERSTSLDTHSKYAEVGKTLTIILRKGITQ